MTTQTAQIIDGKAIAARNRQELSDRVRALRASGREVRLDAVLAAPAESGATIYAQNQGRACEALGIDYQLHTLAPDATFDDVAGRVLLLNEREDVTGIMVHMPLPDTIDPYQVQRLIRPEKDVEGVNPANIGNVVYGRSSLVPCTALAVVTMIESTGIDLAGRRAVVVGASNIVGKPVAVLLMRREATVISCNIHTQRIEELTREADVLISAVGKPGLITPGMVKPGACVVDVGTTRVENPETGECRTVGDVDFEGVREVAGWLSPVPGGVGPVTVSMLMRNVVDAAQ
ncbi:MAG: bifunctional 5,10-methylenetetrahydrofolate dehydrogenase/5,10-methenyltetrahydrofolate cyclohydrolase [Phycisphaerales bacterium JB043]